MKNITILTFSILIIHSLSSLPSDEPAAGARPPAAGLERDHIFRSLQPSIVNSMQEDYIHFGNGVDWDNLTLIETVARDPDPTNLQIDSANLLIENLSDATASAADFLLGLLKIMHPDRENHNADLLLNRLQSHPAITDFTNRIEQWDQD